MFLLSSHAHTTYTPSQYQPATRPILCSGPTGSPHQGARVWSLTCFDANVRAPDLAGCILRSAEIVIVVYKAIEGGGGEGVELQSPVGMHVPDVRHIVDVVPRGQVPSKSRAGGARGRAGHHHTHRAGEGYLLQGVIYKVEAGANILRAGCRGGKERASVRVCWRDVRGSLAGWH